MNGDPDKRALAAEYYVLVWKSETVEVNPPRFDKEADRHITHEAVDIVPGVYAEPNQTPFKFTVESGKKNVFDPELDSNAKPQRR